MKGQIAALEQAIENEAECSSLLQQLASVRGAVKGLMTVVLESYLREEFPDTNKRRGSQTKSINDAISIVRSYLR
ncbi:metal-sensing transcriptional repressor [Escherichia coli]|nr:metal-sensing transcriptional repressor [Escherichia coli]MBT0604728.1 metal-sensing transcriptional repressor [Klebsiella quasipneumoniae]